MVSRSRLNTPATPSPQAGPDPSYVRLSCKCRRSLGDKQVEYVDHEGGVHQKRQDHARQPPAPELYWFREEPAVEQDEQRRVEEHHEPTPRRVDLALAPELACLEEGHLQRVGREPADPVHDTYVRGEENREAGKVEEVLEPGP